jgi:hypothetical protein
MPKKPPSATGMTDAVSVGTLMARSHTESFFPIIPSDSSQTSIISENARYYKAAAGITMAHQDRHYKIFKRVYRLHIYRR